MLLRFSPGSARDNTRMAEQSNGLLESCGTKRFRNRDVYEDRHAQLIMARSNAPFRRRIHLRRPFLLSTELTLAVVRRTIHLYQHLTGHSLSRSREPGRHYGQALRRSTTTTGQRVIFEAKRMESATEAGVGPTKEVRGADAPSDQINESHIRSSGSLDRRFGVALRTRTP